MAISIIKEITKYKKNKPIEEIDFANGLKQTAKKIEIPYAKRLENFKKKFEEVVAKSIPKELLTPEISIDAEIEISEITPKFFRIIQQMAPFGPQNMKPIFKTTSVRDNGYGKQVGADKTHLKLNIIAGADKKTYNAIGFNLGNKLELINNDFDIAYVLDENEWNGVKSIQLLLKDIR